MHCFLARSKESLRGNNDATLIQNSVVKHRENAKLENERKNKIKMTNVTLPISKILILDPILFIDDTLILIRIAEQNRVERESKGETSKNPL